MGETLFRLQGITKAFADRMVLKDVTLQVGKTQRVGIIGPNGCGKSTLLNILVGNTLPDSGTVEWLYAASTYYYLMQTPEPSPRLPDEQTELYVLSRGIGLPTEIARGLDAPAQTQHTLSGGERQKLAIAEAWSTQADLLILDEPTNHLDDQGIAWLIDQIQQYRGAVVIVSHDRYVLD